MQCLTTFMCTANKTSRFPLITLNITARQHDKLFFENLWLAEAYEEFFLQFIYKITFKTKPSLLSFVLKTYTI